MTPSRFAARPRSAAWSRLASLLVGATFAAALPWTGRASGDPTRDDAA